MFNVNDNLVKFFHKNTGLNCINVTSLQNRISNVLNNSNYRSHCFLPNKIYNQEPSKSIFLSNKDIESNQNSDLYKCLMGRRTNSNLPKINKKMDFTIFSQIIRYSFGISKKSVGLEPGTKNYYFTYPTEGALNTIEIYIIITNVSKIPMGIYLYNPFSNSIILVKDDFKLEDYKHVTGLNNQANNSFFSVHIVGNGKFSFQKYGERSYRFMNIEAGHCSQNLYLVTRSLGFECAASGAFLDDEFFEYCSEISNIDGNRFLLYENFVGI